MDFFYMIFICQKIILMLAQKCNLLQQEGIQSDLTLISIKMVMFVFLCLELGVGILLSHETQQLQICFKF